MIDTDTQQLDRDLSVENQLRAQLDAAIADNKALANEVEKARRLAHRWRTRALNPRKEIE